MDLVVSRGCRHVDWCTISGTHIEFCRSCGLVLIIAVDRLLGDAFIDVHTQPHSGSTFDPARRQSFDALSCRYDALDLESGRQIRVLVLRAGCESDPLRCDLEHTNLQQGPNFEAVSYIWVDANGDDSLSSEVLCRLPKRSIAITRNCEAALRRLRKPNTDRRLWIDAICIDQSNVLERNHQVKNIIASFRSASRVLVFLGEGEAVLDRLTDYISNDTAGQLPQILDFLYLF